MKQLMIWSLLIILLVGFSMAGVEAQLTAKNTFDKNNPTHGSATQEASNPKHDDTIKKDIFVTSTITIKNSDLTNAIIIDSIGVNPASGFSATDLQLTLVGGPTTIPKNGEASIQIKARIPETLDAVDSAFDAVAFLIANVDLFENTVQKGTVQIWMQRENGLSIKDIKAIINGKGSQSIDPGDDLENIKPGDKIELEVGVENNFDDETNLDAEDVKLKIQCDNEDNFDFDDKTEDIGDIGTEDEETERITFSVQDDAEDEDTTCDISAEGKDENGARHGELLAFDVQIQRKSHDIIIKSVNANPTSLSCDDTTINLRVEYMNLGRSDEDRVAIEATSRILNYQERIAGLELDENDRDEKIFLVPVNPRTISQGPFIFQLQTFYDNTKLSETATLTMDNLCSEGQPVNTGKPGTGNNEPRGVGNALVVGAEKITLSKDSLASVAVKVVNKEEDSVEYTVSLDNIDDFAEPSSSKKVFLNAGQESTVFLNLKAKSNLAPGLYSGTVVLEDAGGNTIETRTFTVEAGGKSGTSTGTTTNTFASLFGGESNSKIFWIIGDVILVIIAIFFIKLIFSGGKRKKDKKMADFEAESTKRKR
ncbi:MAG: hypothetical protein AABW64_02930 [Nanoarchaeota archaeon]